MTGDGDHWEAFVVGLLGAVLVAVLCASIAVAVYAGQ